MGRALIRSLALLACGLLAGSVLAERLDDSLSPQQQIKLELDWKNPVLLDRPDEKTFNSVIAHARNIDVRLDTSRHMGKEVRIYLSLPILIRGLSNPHSMNFSWTTNGLFLDGELTPGNRQLIFEGTITRPVMIDYFNYTFELDGRYLTETLRLEPVYEIETVTP